MADTERIAVLESKVKEIDKTIQEIREGQEAARCRDTEGRVSMKELTVRLETLIGNLAQHEEWHRDNTGNKFNLSNIIVSVCALLVLVFDLVIRLPG